MSYNPDTGLYTGYIYCIQNKVNGKKYIGQTIMTIRRRWNVHVSDANLNKSNTALIRAFHKYGFDNFSVSEIVRVESKDRDILRKHLDDLEQFFIKIHNSLCKKNGYNIQTGGTNGRSKYAPIDVYSMDGKLLNQFDTATSASEYYDINVDFIYNVCAGRTDNYYNKYVFRRKGDAFDKYPVVDTSKKQLHCIDVYDKNTLEYITTYRRVKECADSLNINYTMISMVCNGVCKSSGNYIFRYSGDPLDKYSYVQQTDPTQRAVSQYTLNDEYVTTHVSLSEAVRSVDGKSTANVYGCCRHKRNKAYGFKWFYADDPNQPDKSRIIPKE